MFIRARQSSAVIGPSEAIAKKMGVRFDSEKNCFVFDFEHDGQNDI